MFAALAVYEFVLFAIDGWSGHRSRVRCAWSTP